MWEAGRNWLRQFLIEVSHPAIFILLLVPRRRHGRLFGLLNS
jgi:hypothetical protein